MKDERLEALKARRDRINALIQQNNARARVQARKESTRRKIVAGTIFLERLLGDEPLRKWFESKLGTPEERRLFGLDDSTVGPGQRHNVSAPSGARGDSDEPSDP
jgi:hypothetical protein